MRQFVKEVSFLVGWFLFLMGLKMFVITPVQVDGSSMKQTLKDEDRGFIYKLGKIERYDIVVFTTMKDGEKIQFIKRVVGLPGETITGRMGDIYIDDTLLTEEFPLEDAELTGDFSYTIPDDYYFVLGDNRGDSTDSRQIGPVAEDTIVGKFVLRFAPYKEMKVF